MRPRHLYLLRRSHCPDDGCAQRLRPLAGNEPDAARGGVEKDRLPLGHPERPLQQEMRGRTLQKRSGRGPVVDAIGETDQPLRRHQPRLGVAAAGPLIDDSVPRLHRRHARANGLDYTSPLAPHHRWQRNRIEPLALVDVDEVQADGGLPDERFSRTGDRHRQLDPFHDLGAAVAFDADHMGHRCAPSPCSNDTGRS